MTAPAISGPSAAPLARRLGVERAGLLARARGAAVLLGVAVAVAVLAGAAVLLGDGRWITWPRAVPVASWGLAVLAAAWCGRRMWRRVETQLTWQGLAGLTEQEQGLRAGSLRGALEVADSGPLGARAAADVAARLPARGTLTPGLQGQLRRAATQVLLLAVGASALLAVVFWQSPDGARAVVHPVGAWRGTLLPALEFVDAPAPW